MLWFVLLAALGAVESKDQTPADLAARIIRFEMQHESMGTRSPTFLSFFSPTLRRAIKRDTAERSVGVLDYDPFCQCQDHSAVQVRLVSIDAQGSKGTVWLESGIEERQTRVKLILEKIGREWKVGDVSTADEPSLVVALAAH
jgi:hypothetical protein